MCFFRGGLCDGYDAVWLVPVVSDAVLRWLQVGAYVGGGACGGRR